MAGGGGDGFMEALGLLLGLTALIALFLSFFRQSTIISFIVVGVVVNMLGMEVDPVTLGHFSQVGIMVLLFMAGLEVEIGAFLKTWKAVSIVGLGQILVSTVGFSLLSLAIFPLIDQPVSAIAAVYFGLCMTFSSTILVLGKLKSSKAMGTVHGQMCLGTLVLQDAASVLSLAVLAALVMSTGECSQLSEAPVDCSVAYTPEACYALSPACTFSSDYNSCKDVCDYLDLSVETDGGDKVCSANPLCSFAPSEGGETGVAAAILLLIGKLVAACLILYALARFVLAKTFELFASSLELLYLGSLGYCLGLAAIAIRLNFSGEITAFLAGVSLTQLEYKLHIESKLDPIKSLGVAIFFIALGLQLDLDQRLIDALPVGLLLAFITLVTTPPLFILLGYAAKLKAHNCFMIGMLMNQISEFSLILCTLTVRAGVLDRSVLTVMTVAAVVSIVFSSIGHIYIDQIYSTVQQWRVFKEIDAHHMRGSIRKQQQSSSLKMGEVEVTGMETDCAVLGSPVTKTPGRAAALAKTPLNKTRPAELESPEWVFEDQLENRNVNELALDLEEVESEMECARTAMSLTAEERRLVKGAQQKAKKTMSHHQRRGKGLTVTTSEKSDIMHGLIEGYVIMNRHLLFCCVRGGRMMFWDDQHDVGHVPPKEVWDVSGMTIEVIKDEVKHMQQLKREKSERGLSERGLSERGFFGGSERTSISGSLRGLGLGGGGRGGGGGGGGVVSSLRKLGKSLSQSSFYIGDEEKKENKDEEKKAITEAEAEDDEEEEEDGKDTVGDIEAGGTRNKLTKFVMSERAGEDLSGSDSDSECDGESDVGASDSDSEDEAKFHPWEWTIVLAHLHRTGDSALTGEDPMKLEIHGLEDHSDHDVEDWRDALSVVLDTLNPIALRRAHIKEAILKSRRELAQHPFADNDGVGSLTRQTSMKNRMDVHNHRHEIICIGYNEMFPAVLSLADATGKEVVVVEYDIQKIKTVKKRYNLQQRELDAEAAKGGGREVMDKFQSSRKAPESYFDGASSAASAAAAAAASPAAAKTTGTTGTIGTDEFKQLARVTCDYADIHDPESWEELEMDQAFMIVFCMKGAHHAEKAIISWLIRHSSDTIFVGVTANNADALHLYDHGADYVLQSDALAMRSTKQIFLDTVAKVGDGSHLKAAGLLHAKRLGGLKRDDKRRFLYETGVGA